MVDRAKYNTSPSNWKDRQVLILMALVCFAISSYLAAYQFGLVSYVWDPVFGTGSSAVLKSKIASALPFPDAALGSLAYLVDIVLLLFGDAQRWCKRPCISLMSTSLVFLISASSLCLLILQPLVVHAWCFLCMVSAIFGLSMVPLARREFVASLSTVMSDRSS